jgi:DNA-binding NtrC family response regulator
MKPIILLVDDEAMLREVMGDVLFKDGFFCVPCANGADAMRLIDAGPYKFDLLLSDVKMPGTVDGFEVAERFKAKYPEGTVILLSGYIDEKSAGSLSKDRVRVLPNPLRVQELLDAVKEALALASILSEGSKVTPLDPNSPLQP